MTFFAIVGFVTLCVLTFGPAAFIFWQGWLQSNFAHGYPMGAVLSGLFFLSLGVIVCLNAPFHLHISLTP